MKNLNFLILATALLFNISASASESTVLDLAKNADGSVIAMSQAEAFRYCVDSKNIAQPAHLPSARELAKLAARNCSTVAVGENCGAKGIVDSCDSSDNKCDQIYAVKDDGITPDFFYYSFAGYRHPVGELGNNMFWSSSAFSGNIDNVYYLDGSVGFILPQSRYVLHYWTKFRMAVRCVPGI